MATTRPGLRSYSTAEIRIELARRQRLLRDLHRRRRRLLEQITRLDGELSRQRDLDTLRAPRIVPEHRPLLDIITDLLRDRAMRVTDIAKAAKKAGFLTASKDFRVGVNQVIIRSGRFRRVSTGVYTLKKDPAPHPAHT